MHRNLKLRLWLPLIQTTVAVVFGGVGLWQRYRILNQPWLDGQFTFWNTTATYHVWPWPFRFAVITNTPAFLVGTFVAWPIQAFLPNLPDYSGDLLAVLLVPFPWYWLGCRLDAQRMSWLFLVGFYGCCLAGLMVPGYISFIAVGIVIWVGFSLLAIMLSERRKQDTVASER